ncbi:hypothetical protein OKW21_003134 [Catalinimonas alkaloidigena]|uniref:hypothetical protein n=1 Tax=Catalinimonas alkaloidigena TaxID=1075417 RepID=UPI002405C5A1|nr:hypothetical protein [Catalinimonas alkaloidigena]MDF9797871.1 hypothetical protein [Catalinimonas alkaloidigena]
MKLTLKKKPSLSWQDRLLHNNTRKVLLLYALPLLALAGISFLLEQFYEKTITTD